MKRIVLIMLAFLLVGACESMENRENTENDMITRYTDQEYRVVCWVYTSGYRGGISCIPEIEVVRR